MNKKQIFFDPNNTQYSQAGYNQLPIKNNLLYITRSEEKMEKNFNISKIDSNKKKEIFNEPFIFKINKQESPIKTIKYINNDTGRTRHFTPAAQEWYNSIYNYNKNYIKSLPTADKNAIKLLKGYLNLFVKNKKNLNKKKIKRMPYKLRKLSFNKVFVGKGNLKHTNNKVIITSYVYNAEQYYLKNKVRELYNILYYPKKALEINYTRLDITKKKTLYDYNRPHTLKEFLNNPTHPTHKVNFPDHSSWHKNVCFRLFWKNYVKLIGQKKILSIDLAARKKVSKRNKYMKEGKKKKIFTSIKDKAKETFLDTFSKNIPMHQILANFSWYTEQVDKNEGNDKLLNFKLKMNIIKIFNNDFDAYFKLAKEFRLKSYENFRYLLMISKAKYEKPFIQKLVDLVKSIYNKNVEFNLINLYKMHLNSDIYTQSVSLKLKDRNNKLFKVLTRSLTKAKLPNVNRSNERYHKENRDEFIINKIRNTYIKNMLLQPTCRHDNNVDPLNNLLADLFPLSNHLKLEVRKRSSIIKRPVSLYKYITRTLRHIKLAGVRIEAKGRLTRRFTASRSVFRVLWKGGLENVDSSFKGLSALMLRGDRKSNVQYSISNSKNRNGAYGVKGWVGSK